MAISSRSEDRRIQRTRQLLRQASIDVMQEKGFKAMSIQEIAERANVSRGTFYAHFVDKYALLESLLREEFQNLIHPLPPVSQWNRKPCIFSFSSYWKTSGMYSANVTH